MRRTLACAGLALLLSPFLPLGSASAHPEHGAFVGWHAPGEGARLAGRNFHIRATVNFGNDGVKSWSLAVDAPPGAGHPAFGTLCEQTMGAAPLSAEIDCAWDTTAYPDGTLSQNRAYVIRITATNAERSLFSPPSQPHTAERRVTVVNDVAAPTGVVLSSSEAGRQATVRWVSNREPDITSYVIQERFGSDGWHTIGEAGSQLRSFSRRLSAPGTYRYQVAARRSTGSGSDTIQSAFSGPAGEPREIVVAEPPKPPPTTTTTAPAKGPDQPAPNPDPDGGDDAGPRPPAGDGPPVPIEAGGTTGENPAPAPAEGPPPGATPGAPTLVTPIAPGSPGSVGFGQTSAGNLVQKGGAAPVPRTPGTLPEPDGPFSETLPYPKADPPPVVDDDGGIGKVLVGLPAVIAGDNRREMIIPLAAGLLLFVVAMHALHLSRRTDQTPLEPDF